MSNPFMNEDAKSRQRHQSRLVTIGLLFLLVGYFVVLVRHASYAVGGSDATGYAHLARTLLQGYAKLPVTEVATFGVHESLSHVFSPLAYAPVMKDGNPTPVLVPIYPIGFPLHEAAAALLIGWRLGPFVVSPLLAALSCWLLYCIARQLGLSRGLAAMGSVVLAVNPTFIFLAQQPMSDVAATFWGLVLIWSGLRSRRDAEWALLAGFAFGFAFLVRPANIVFLAPLLFCLPLRPRAILHFALGGLPLGLLFLSYNYVVFGHPLQTGYSAINLQGAFESTGLMERFRFYIYWIAVTMSPVVLGGWLASAFLRKVEWRLRALLIAWLASFLIFYSAYDIYGVWWYTRFLLPAYPALILGTLLTIQALGDLLLRNRRGLRWATGIVLCVALCWMPLQFVYKNDVLSFGGGELLHLEACAWADKQLPERAVVVSMEMSGAVRFYTHRSIVRYDAVVPWLWPELRKRVEERGYGFYALLMDMEVENAQKGVPGHWTEMGHLRHIGLWRIQPLDRMPAGIKYGDGFSELERTPDGVSWRWMSDEGVALLENTGRPMRLRIEGAVPIYGFKRSSTIKVILNGALLETVVAGGQALVLEYQISKSQQGDRESSELRLVADQALTPNDIDPRNPDRRRLSFSLTGLRWEETSQ
ncbi:MAG: hypothetical protein ABI882_12020 [Acidobacteriota bacterium]